MIGHGISRLLAASMGLMAAAGTAAGETTSREALEAEIKTLSARMAEIEAKQQARRRAAAAAAVEAGSKPRSWKLPGTNTSMSVGGFIYLHGNVTFSGGGFVTGGARADASLASATAEGTAAENSFNGGHFQFNARHSRLIIQTWTPTDWGELRTYIETDFREASNAVFRLRKAFGTLGPVLAGQDDSTFRMNAYEPNSLDPGFAILTPESRKALIRYSHNFGGGLVVHVAIEDPTENARTASCALGACVAAGTGFAAAQRRPDFVARADYFFPQGQISVAGKIVELSRDSGGPAGAGGVTLAVDDRTTGWGVDVAGKFKVHPRVQLGFIGFIGEGIGSAIQGINFSDAIFNITPGSNGASLDQILTYGAVGWVEVKLTDTISANGWGGWALQEAEDEVNGATKAIRKTVLAGQPDYAWFAGGNLIWSPIPRASFGIEYLHGFAARYAGANATLSRVNLGFRYQF